MLTILIKELTIKIKVEKEKKENENIVKRKRGLIFKK